VIFIIKKNYYLSFSWLKNEYLTIFNYIKK
jgi:hypothetical protein